MALDSTLINQRLGLKAELSAALSRAGSWTSARMTWLSLSGACVVVAALYGRAMHFAFFFDDTYDLTRTEDRSYLSLLTSSHGYSYYRPIPFVIWKALRSLQGRYDQPTMHVLPLIAHALAGWFLFLLLRRLGTGTWALLPALLFLTYPFDYQAVPISGTLFHPLAGAVLLGALLAYVAARTESTRWKRNVLYAVALAAALIALWTHESAVVIAPFIIGVEVVLMVRRGERCPSVWVLPFVAVVVLFVATWYLVDRTPSPETTSISELRPKGLYLLQGVTYPVSAQLVWLEDRIGWAPGVLQVALAAGVAVATAYLVAGRRSGARGRHLLGALAIPALAIAAALAAFLPVFVRLSYAYVAESPRLLYLVGIGAAIFWGLLPSLDFRNQRVNLVWRTLTLLLLAGVVVQSWRFVDLRMKMFERGTAVIDRIVATGEEFRGEQVVFVNAPSWFAQDRYEYPLGHFGVQLMPSYIGLDRVIYTSSAISAYVDAASVSLNPVVSGGAYPFGPHGPSTSPEQLNQLLRDGREVINVVPAAQDFEVRDVGRLVPARAEVRQDFPGEIADAVWISNARTAVEGGKLTVLFQWNVVAPLQGDANSVIELRTPEGRLVQRYIGYPLNGVSAPRLWQAGDRIDDSVEFELPRSGTYTIWAGLTSIPGDRPLQTQPGPNATDTEDGMLQLGTTVVS